LLIHLLIDTLSSVFADAEMPIARDGFDSLRI